jgi:NAD(P)-dependent dehydrogenase (short-subunit alcohol dehydrogenase family)
MMRLFMSYTATTEQLDAVTAVNIRGTFLCYKYAAMQMVKQGRGGRLIGTLVLIQVNAVGEVLIAF